MGRFVQTLCQLLVICIISTIIAGLLYLLTYKQITQNDIEYQSTQSIEKDYLGIKFSPHPILNPKEIEEYYKMGVITEEGARHFNTRYKEVLDSGLKSDMSMWKKQKSDLQQFKKSSHK